MSKKHKVSNEVVEDAMKVAKATQKPGQTKEQTKLIAQGIQKGIEEYKKRHKQKARALDKEKNKLQKKNAQQDQANTDIPVEEVTTQVEIKQSMLAWGLLGLSWLGFIAYVVQLGGF